MAFRVSQCALLFVLGTLLCTQAWAQCSTLMELHTLSGTVQFSNSSGAGAFCVRLYPQPRNRAMEVKSIVISLDPGYALDGGELIAYSTWFPMDSSHYIIKSWDECCDSQTTITAKSPIVTIVYNTTYSIYPTITLTFASQAAPYRTKFSMGFFQGVVVAVFLPIFVLVVSLCTFQRGVCNKANQRRRLSRKTPLAERIATSVAVGIGILFFFLLIFRVFG